MQPRALALGIERHARASSRGAAEERFTEDAARFFFRRSAAELCTLLSYPGLTPLGYILSPLRG